MYMKHLFKQKFFYHVWCHKVWTDFRELKSSFVCVCTFFPHVQHFVAPQTLALQALLVEFCSQEYWSRVPFPPLGDLLDPGIKPTSLVSPALAGGFFTTSTTWKIKLSSQKTISFLKIFLKPFKIKIYIFIYPASRSSNHNSNCKIFWTERNVTHQNL